MSESKDILKNPLWDPNVIKHEVLPYIRKCMQFELTDKKYEILDGGDCLEEYIDILRQIPTDKTRLLVFTPTMVEVYKPKNNLMLHVGDVRIHINEQQISKVTRSRSGSRKTPYSPSEIITLLQTHRRSFSHMWAKKILSYPRRTLGMPYNLNINKYALLVLPNKRSFIVKLSLYPAKYCIGVIFSTKIIPNSDSRTKP